MGTTAALPEALTVVAAQPDTAACAAAEKQIEARLGQGERSPIRIERGPGKGEWATYHAAKRARLVDAFRRLNGNSTSVPGLSGEMCSCTMYKRLRVGVIGAGAWAVASHLPTLAKRPEVQLVAVNRRDRRALDRIQHRCGFAFASTDYREVLAKELDLVIVSSPAASHYEHAKAAMESGAHVLVEKPFTVSPDEAWGLVETAERLQRHVVIALGWHYRPMVAAAKELLKTSRSLGETEYIALSMSSPTREALLGRTPQFSEGAPRGGGIISAASKPDPDLASQPATMNDVKVSGGGYAQAQLSHALGLALWLTELRGQSVFALMQRPSGLPVEYHDALVVSFTNGAIGTVSGGSSHRGANRDKHSLQLHVIGSSGEVLLDLGREALWHVDSDGHERRLPFGPGDGDYSCEGPVNTACDLALGRLVDNASPAELGARTVEIIAAAYESERLRRQVMILTASA